MPTRFRERLLDLVFPATCVGCKMDLPRCFDPPLCGCCLGRLVPLSKPQCRRCASPVKANREHCRHCRSRIFAVDAVRAAFPYAFPLPELLFAFKYRGRLAIGRVLAGWMAGLFPRFSIFKGIEAVIPVPLHGHRQKERGFNQAEILAAEIARIAGLSLLPCLERTRNTAPQWKLGKRERAGNLQDAFRISRGISLQGSAVLLVDDVCATGGTLEGCARALQAAGAARILAYVLARD